MRVATGHSEKNVRSEVKSLAAPVFFRQARIIIAVCLTVLWVSSGVAGAATATSHPVMHLSGDQMTAMMAAHLNAEPMDAVLGGVGDVLPPALPPSLSLLSYLPYVPVERDQGECGDCWAWAGTGALEIAHNVQNGVSNRLSVQFLNTCNPYVSCCDGGWLDNLSQFYGYEGFAVPWSNTNAAWSSGDGSCAVSCGSIGTAPQYPITSMSVTTVSTWGVGQAQAIANIKAALNQNQAVWFGFFMGSQTDWDNFDNFWDSQPESAQWTSFNPGEAYTSGGGHAILCVGYDDNDTNGPSWIMVNSWGITSSRPDGTLRVSQNVDYDGTYTYGSYPYQQLYFETLNVQFASQVSNTLTINVNGTGSVLMGGSNAPSTITLPYGQVVNLTAQGSFLGWSGAETSANTNVQVVLTTNLTITANFQDGTNALAPFIVTQPISQTVAAGSNFSLSIAGSGIPAPAFSWLMNGQPVGVETATLTITNASAANQGSYSCILNNSAGEVQSASVLVNVEGTPAFVQQPVSQIVALGGTATFSAVENSTNVTCQWYKSTSALPGCTSTSLVVSDAQLANAGSYSLVITNASIAESATSAVVTLTVVSKPVISVQPISTNVILGSNATLSVTASGIDLSYIWKRATNIVQSSTNNTCLVNSSIAGTASYAVIVSNLAGSVTSSPANVLVIGPPTTGPMQTNKYLAVGSNWTISVLCTNVAGTYAWFFNTTNALSSTTNSYSITNATTNESGAYSLVLSNIAGVVTNTVNLSVFLYPSILSQPASTNILPAGTNLGLVVGAAGSALRYQWSKNSVALIGATNATLSISNLAAVHSGDYTVLVSNAVGSAISHNSVLTVIPPPIIASQLANKYLDAGSNCTIVFPCTNVAGTCSWFFNGTNALSSATNRYTITNATTNLSGAYSLVLSNIAGVATGTIDLLVFTYPSIVSQPAPTNVLPVGTNVNLVVGAYGSSLTYHWSRNAKAIPGATNATLSMSNLLVSNSGSYTVLVSNEVGKVTSHISVLTVIPPPTIVAKPKTQSLVVNEPLNLSVVATGTKPYTNLTYQWQFGTNIANATNSTYRIPNISSNWAGAFTVVVTDFGGSTNASAIVTVVPDTSPPKLTVITPAKAVTNSPYTLSGTAKDLVAVTNVAFSLDGGAGFTNGATTNSWSNWSASLPLVIGTNTVTVVATDINGLTATNTSKIKYAPFFAATLTASGNGTGVVTGFTNQMQYGVTYTLVAKPSAQNLFQYWSGLNGVTNSTSTNAAKLTFTVTNTVDITVSFATNQFFDQAGVYNGLFYQSNGATHQSAGFLNVTITTNLTYSGKVLLAGQILTISGQVGTNGAASVALNPDVTLAFTMADQQLTGTVSSGEWTSYLTADLAVFKASNPNTNFAGSFDIVVPPDTNGSVTTGYGCGAVTVSSTGNVTLVGSTADGTALSQSVPISQDGVWPLFVQIYPVNKTNTAGEILGWITFATNGTPTGNVTWIKTAYASTGSYVNGLTNNSAILSSTFTAPTKSNPIVLNGMTNGELAFTGGNLISNIEAQVYMTNSGSIYSYDHTITMKFSSGGLFTGKFIDDANGASTSFYGAALQNTTNAYGYFPGPAQSGSVILDTSSSP